MIVPMLLANLQAFLPSNALPIARLFTWKRGRRALSYVAIAMLAVGWTWSGHAQVVVELDRGWSEEEVLRALEAQPLGPEWTVVKGLDAPWPGVEVLDQRMEWAPCSAGLEARIREPNPSKHVQKSLKSSVNL